MIDGADVIVVGGGAIGCTVARELAPTHNVILLEREDIATGATSRGLGIIHPQFQFGHLPRAGRYAFQFFESLDGNRSYEYTDRELLHLHGSDQTPVAKKYTDSITGQHGYDATWLSTDEISQRYSGVFETDRDDLLTGGVLHNRAGWIDADTFAMTMRGDIRRRGVDIRTNVEVTGIRAENGNVVGVETDEGRVHSPRVVVAAGWRTRALLEEHIAIPIQPERFWRAFLTTPTENVARIAEKYPMWYVDLQPAVPVDRKVDTSLETFWRPTRDGELVATGRVGPPREEQSTTEATVHEIVRMLSPRLLQQFDATATIRDVDTTDDAVTPDRRPIVDTPEDAPDGLVIATGFSGRGLTAAPVAAAAVRKLLFGYGAPFDLDSLSLERFDTRTPDFTVPSFNVFTSASVPNADRKIT